MCFLVRVGCVWYVPKPEGGTGAGWLPLMFRVRLRKDRQSGRPIAPLIDECPDPPVNDLLPYGELKDMYVATTDTQTHIDTHAHRDTCSPTHSDTCTDTDRKADTETDRHEQPPSCHLMSPLSDHWAVQRLGDCHRSQRHS